jgi:hypothetical protein
MERPIGIVYKFLSMSSCKYCTVMKYSIPLLCNCRTFMYNSKDVRSFFLRKLLLILFSRILCMIFQWKIRHLFPLSKQTQQFKHCTFIYLLQNVSFVLAIIRYNHRDKKWTSVLSDDRSRFNTMAITDKLCPYTACH